MKIKIFVSLFVFYSSFLSAQENLSLSDAIKKGLENNYSIRITSLNVDITENNNSWGTAGMFPQIGLSANLGNSFNDTDQETEITMAGNTITSDSTFSTNSLSLSPGVSLN